MSNPKPSKSWQKGQSGNPAGRPKTGETWAELLARKLSEVADNGKTRKENMADALVRMYDNNSNDSEDSNNHLAIKAINMIMDRMDGRPNQSVAMTGEDGGALKIEVEFKEVEE